MKQLKIIRRLIYKNFRLLFTFQHQKMRLCEPEQFNNLAIKTYCHKIMQMIICIMPRSINQTSNSLKLDNIHLWFMFKSKTLWNPRRNVKSSRSITDVKIFPFDIFRHGNLTHRNPLICLSFGRLTVKVRRILGFYWDGDLCPFRTMMALLCPLKCV